MALADPFDLLADFPGWTTDFDLVYRQETSRQANGVTRVKDLGSPIWGGTWQSRTLWPNELDRWRAKLKVLEGGAKRFFAWPSSRCYPIADPGGAIMTARDQPTLTLDFVADYALVGGGYTLKLGSVAADRKTITLSGGPARFQYLTGDYLRIGDRDLHQVMEDRTASSNGSVAAFEVRPHLWPGVAAGASVTLIRPHCLMTIVPGSISTSADPQTGRGAVSFQAMEAR